MEMADEKPIHTIILDSGPIIRNNPSASTLLQKCTQILTTPSVISEIRDEVTRARLQTLLRQDYHYQHRWH